MYRYLYLKGNVLLYNVIGEWKEGGKIPRFFVQVVSCFNKLFFGFIFFYGVFAGGGWVVIARKLLVLVCFWVLFGYEMTPVDVRHE